jgi:hypothetical protein
MLYSPFNIPSLESGEGVTIELIGLSSYDMNSEAAGHSRPCAVVPEVGAVAFGIGE